MRTKKRFFIAGIGILFTLLLALLAIFLMDKPQETTTASAATSSSAVCVTVGKLESYAGNVQGTGSPSGNYTITMESSNASGSGTLEDHCVIDWNYVKIKSNIIKISDQHTFNLEKDGNNIYGLSLEGKASQTLYEGPLSDGDYCFSYYARYTIGNTLYAHYYRFRFTVDITAPTSELKAGGETISSGSTTNKNIAYSASDAHFKYIYYKKPNASSFSTTTNTFFNVEATQANTGWWEFYATDTLGQASSHSKIYLDCQAPTLLCGLGASFGGTTGKSFNVSATDGSGTAKLYVKFESEEWFSTGSSYTVPVTERNGRYYFYGEDGVGNCSETSWVILSTEEPSGSFVKSDSDNSVSFVWNNQYWSAKLDGANYTEGKFISSEGQHEIVLSNNALKKKNYTFKIDHYYVVVDQIAATCFADGVRHYECSQCGDSYEEVLYSSGHQYNIISSPSSCTESGRITYACNKCGDRYETDGSYPKGHNYVVTILKEPTCTEEGIRLSTCEDCGDSYETTIAANGHNYGIAEVETSKGKTTRIYTCDTCGATYKQELGDQYEAVSNYVEYLFLQYQPYMWWVFLAAAGVWSIVIGVMIAIAQKHEDKEKSKKMLINYVIGLVVIAVILVACPFLMRGIAALIT